jgi:anti-sigma-K factor RskA
MDSEHALYRENIAAYALGALEAGDTAALEAHLLTCESCRSELAEYRALSAGLAAAVPPRRPPAALRSQLRDRLPSRRREAPRAFGFLRQALVPALLLVLLATNVLNFLQVQQLQKQQDQLVRQVRTAQTALAMLAYPTTRSLAIHAGEISGTFLLDADRNTAMLIMWDLPPLPENQTYQAWLVQPDGVRVSAAVFRPAAEGSYTAQPLWPDQSLSSYTAIGVTIEPAGGSPQPTGQRLFKVDFQS